jgi:branched-chain amino acid transport system substrate-binding protein
MNVVEMVRSQLEDTGGVSPLDEKGQAPIKVSIITRGIPNAPESAVSTANQFVNQDQVHILIGPQHSGDAIPVGEVAESSGILMISPMSTNPKTTAGRKNVLRIGFLDDLQGEVLADIAYKELNAKTAAILYDIARPYNKGIAEKFIDNFEKIGGSVVTAKSYVTGQEDFSQELKVIASLDPELLLLPNHNNDVLLQGPQARQAGIKAVFLGGDAWNEQLLAPMPEFDGAYKTAHWAEFIDTPANHRFVEKYRSRFGSTPNNTAALTWDAFQIVFQAVRQAGTVSPTAIRDALYALGPFDGLSGTIDYKETGDPVKSVAVLSFQEGKVVFNKMVTP